MKEGGYIYKWLCLIDGCIYIGSTCNLSKRKYEHISHLRENKHHSIHFQRAWNKYGEENFKFEILELVEDKSQLIKREQYYLDTLLSASENNNRFHELGYNICRKASSTLGIKQSEYAKVKRRETHLNNPHIRINATKLRLQTLKSNPSIQKNSHDKARITKINNPDIEVRRVLNRNKTFKENPEIKKNSIEKLKNTFSKKPVLICPKCGYKSRRINIKQHHFDNCNPIIQLSNKYEFIKEFSSLIEAEKETSVKSTNISRVCKHIKNYNTAGGYIWLYKSEFLKSKTNI